MLMKIAAHPILSNANHGSLLPRSWRTLAELSRLPEEMLERALAEKLIRPEMPRGDVNKLRVKLGVKLGVMVRVTAPPAADTPPAEPQTAPRATADDLGLDDVHRDLAAAFADLDADEQRKVVVRLREIAAALERQIPAFVMDVMASEGAGAHIVEPGGAEYHCTSCDRYLDEAELVTIRECSAAECEGTYFDGTNEGRNCPTCGRPFTRRITDHGCPDCLEEDSIEDVQTTAAVPA